MKRPATRTVHPPRRKEGRTTPAAPPLDFSTAHFVPDLGTLDDLQQGRLDDGYYRRYGHRNARELEGAVAELEAPGDRKVGALACASGMSAVVALFWGLLEAGSHVVCGRDVYGGTYGFLARHASRLGIATTFVESTPAAVRAALRRETRAVAVETITNPLMTVPDLPGIVKAAGGVPVFVDNTFATPVLARPLEHGAAVSWHSGTKYLCGHADAMSGVIVAAEDRIRRMRSLLSQTGGAVSPMDAWLTLRGIRTLDVRVRRASAVALELAGRLSKSRQVSRVHYPGLKSSPSHATAKRLLDGAHGGMLSFELKGGLASVRKFVDALELVRLLPSLGDVETTITHPARTSHAYLSPAERAAAGVTDGLVRVSAGLEDPEDLWADLDQALKRSTT